MIIIGVDEAGRGPLAGPVVAGAVVLPPEFDAQGLADSKKLTPDQRDHWYGEITARARWAAGIATVAEIEEINILQASLLAMRRAVRALKLVEENFEVWVDGNQKPKLTKIKPTQIKCIIGGDDLHAPISAASVIAKVTRDRMMQKLHRKYPHYGWDSNKGYSCRAHFDAIIQHGATPMHRTVFLRKVYERHATAA